MKLRIALACAVAVLALVSCRAVGLWLAPIEKRDLPAESRKLVETAEAEKDKAVAALGEGHEAAVAKLTEQIDKLEAAHASKMTWLWVAFSGLGLLCFTGGIVIAIWLKEKGLGAGLMVGGVALFILCQTWIAFGDIVKIVCGCGLLGLVLMVLIYAGFQLYKRLRGVVFSFEAAKPSMAASRELVMDTVRREQTALGVRDAVQSIRKRAGWTE